MQKSISRSNLRPLVKASFIHYNFKLTNLILFRESPEIWVLEVIQEEQVFQMSLKNYFKEISVICINLIMIYFTSKISRFALYNINRLITNSLMNSIFTTARFARNEGREGIERSRWPTRKGRKTRLGIYQNK